MPIKKDHIIKQYKKPSFPLIRFYIKKYPEQDIIQYILRKFYTNNGVKILYYSYYGDERLLFVRKVTHTLKLQEYNPFVLVINKEDIKTEFYQQLLEVLTYHSTYVNINGNASEELRLMTRALSIKSDFFQLSLTSFSTEGEMFASTNWIAYTDQMIEILKKAKIVKFVIDFAHLKYLVKDSEIYKKLNKIISSITQNSNVKELLLYGKTEHFSEDTKFNLQNFSEKISIVTKCSRSKKFIMYDQDSIDYNENVIDLKVNTVFEVENIASCNISTLLLREVRGR